MTKVYEVYQCKYKGEIVYIGQGGRGRHRHCNSGVSHVFELNEIFFTEGSDELFVEVVNEYDCKEDAESREILLIRKHIPTFNKVYNNNLHRNQKVLDSKKLKDNLLNASVKLSDNELTVLCTQKYEGIVSEFYKFFGFKSIVSKSFTLFGANHYKSLEFHHLRNLSSTVRTQNIVKRSSENPYILFIKALYLYCDIDLIEHLDKRPKSLISNTCLDSLKRRKCNE